MKKVIYRILLFIWMCFIFYMSHKSGESSNNISSTVIEVFNSIGIDINGLFGRLANFIVRKSAHITEYFILALLMYNSITEKIEKDRRAMITLILCILYAGTDEIHQLFIIGRTGKFKDVLIDSIGIFIYTAAIIIKNKFRKKI